jgi:hypothetical protein
LSTEQHTHHYFMQQSTTITIELQYADTQTG